MTERIQCQIWSFDTKLVGFLQLQRDNSNGCFITNKLVFVIHHYVVTQGTLLIDICYISVKIGWSGASATFIISVFSNVSLTNSEHFQDWWNLSFPKWPPNAIILFRYERPRWIKLSHSIILYIYSMQKSTKFTLEIIGPYQIEWMNCIEYFIIFLLWYGSTRYHRDSD